MFSQLSFSLEAFAEEVINDDVSTVEESNEVTVDDFVGMPETGGGKAKSLSLAWGIGALYACTDEFHQRFVPGRSGELRDVGIDCCGVLTGVLLYTAYRHLKNRQQAMSERK